MKSQKLDQCLEYYSISHFFEQISGLDDHYAQSGLRQDLGDLGGFVLKKSARKFVYF